MQNLEEVKRVAHVADLERMNETLNRLFQGYTDSQISANDDHERRKEITEDFFTLKPLLKSLNN